jgi:hypothetical protein
MQGGRNATVEGGGCGKDGNDSICQTGGINHYVCVSSQDQHCRSVRSVQPSMTLSVVDYYSVYIKKSLNMNWDEYFFHC